ncbi:hypothetical protein IWX49DRAFT_416920 [Phyllosticta citricarpa]|uniref:Uncharacterized protein n=1 Tax=Phyllosticta citricarpa TaxID=55181 RepID=A0ABR1MDK9_9PEZI
MQHLHPRLHPSIQSLNSQASPGPDPRTRCSGNGRQPRPPHPTPSTAQHTTRANQPASPTPKRTHALGFPCPCPVESPAAVAYLLCCLGAWVPAWVPVWVPACLPCLPSVPSWLAAPCPARQVELSPPSNVASCWKGRMSLTDGAFPFLLLLVICFMPSDLFVAVVRRIFACPRSLPLDWVAELPLFLCFCRYPRDARRLAGRLSPVSLSAIPAMSEYL